MFHFKSLSTEQFEILIRQYSARFFGPLYSSKHDNPPPSQPIQPQMVERNSDSTLGPLSDLENRERSDTYSHTVLRIDDTWRVIVCPEGLQWILQKRKGYLGGRPAWDGKSFCRSKTGLRRAIKDKVGAIPPEIESQLAQLPDWVQL
ncbi:hypothetical protein [Mesorhizobium sp. ESP-6-2]|uniref:hypothetical protein n=1 Tax=Mesorhizobium sp. ESP-6-2 TaxID=2876625 RepID=UPI001CC9BD68|nr:hypothetical protein [Mesorhizobium sp. ESP-6-2]MBZ9808316.1 hypothetical protein [Mesorhizobium sp. ESP-6-2]